MLEIKLQPICYECKDIDVTVAYTKFYSGGEVVEVYHAIVCTHERVCKKIKADGKQKPKKPIYDEHHVLVCPNCKIGTCQEGFHTDYCCSCGQALDWSGK